MAVAVGSEAIILLLSERVPQGLFLDLAPSTEQTPFSVYTIIGSRVEEALDGNVGGAGYLVQVNSYADNPVAARAEYARVRALLEGKQRTSQGLAVRIDFNSEASTGAEVTADAKDNIYGWRAEFEAWPGF